MRAEGPDKRWGWAGGGGAFASRERMLEDGDVIEVVDPPDQPMRRRGPLD